METYLLLSKYIPTILILLAGLYYILANPIGKGVTKANKNLLIASSEVLAPEYVMKATTKKSTSKVATKETNNGEIDFGTLQVGKGMADLED